MALDTALTGKESDPDTLSRTGLEYLWYTGAWPRWLPGALAAAP